MHKHQRPKVTGLSIPTEALDAAMDALDTSWITDASRDQRREMMQAVIEAAAPYMLAAATVLINELTEHDECQFDHHGGCQAHGYHLSPGELCPQQKAKDWARAHEELPRG